MLNSGQKSQRSAQQFNILDLGNYIAIAALELAKPKGFLEEWTDKGWKMWAYSPYQRESMEVVTNKQCHPLIPGAQSLSSTP